MVHKKFIRIKGKTYGPYYYESYREDGKIKKRYVKNPPEDCRVKGDNDNIRRKKIPAIFIIYYILVLLLVIGTLFFYFIPEERLIQFRERPDLLFSPPQASVGTNLTVRLATWDDTDTSVKKSGDLVGFYAEYTRVSDGTPISDVSGGICDIIYTYDGIVESEAMNFDIIDGLWKASKIFSYKGTHNFDVLCTSSEGDITVSNNFIITNTLPLFTISGTTTNGLEDTTLLSDFSLIVDEKDINDVLRYSIEGIDGIFGHREKAGLFDYYWISIDSNTGILTIDSTRDNETGLSVISVLVLDSSDTGVSEQFNFVIAPVNDPPFFRNLMDMEFNRSELFEYVIIGDDEESYYLDFNISFLSCETAQWSDRGSTNCELFDNTMYEFNETSINISFVPNRNDVGYYIINFSVNDSGNPSARYSEIANFTVRNVNEPPYFRYVCDNERVTLEDSDFKCYINATDIDEIHNLTFISNYTWFLDNKSVDVDISTDYNGSILINFIPTDINVGNWEINVTVSDTEKPIGRNSTEFSFLVNNKDDPVDLWAISDITEFTSNNYRNISINASDDDLLIPDKSVYDEVLSFESSNTACVSVRPLNAVFGTNITEGLIEFNPSNSACFTPGNSYDITITVRDKDLFSVDSDVFRITISSNNAPEWRLPLQTVHNMSEDNNFYLDLSANVSDADLQPLTFSSSEVDFPSFGLNPTTGIIAFSPEDADVGEHIFNILVSDGITPVSKEFNFTIYNVNDAPYIEIPLLGNSITINETILNMNTTEDSEVELFLFVQDEDFIIPFLQKNYYDDVLKLNLSIEGPNNNLFQFGDILPLDENRSMYISSFIPRKTDVGDYNVTINISDKMNASSFISFNISIVEINHLPILMNLTNQSAAVNISFYYDINASDIEDGNDSSGNLTFSYEFLADGNVEDFIRKNESIFNSTSGVFNFTFNESYVGKYHLNITVNDSAGTEDYEDFWLSIYDKPVIYLPLNGVIFKLAEGNETNLTFMANHSVGDDLRYYFYLNDSLIENFSSYGNGSNVVWNFTPSYNDETYGLFTNLTLVVSVSGLDDLNDSMTWDVNITHGNAPIVFNNTNPIENSKGPYGASILIDLKEHFNDADAFDTNYNQSVIFVVKSNINSSKISYSVDSNWIMSLSSSSAIVEILNITGSDLNSSGSVLTNDTSNNFRIEFIEPIIVPVPVPQPSSGGGSSGSSTRERPVSLKILLPDPVSARKGDLVILNIGLVNDGPVTLNKINLKSILAKDGITNGNFNISLDKDYISSLPVGGSENVTLTAVIDTSQLGLYEININASVEDPVYFDWGKIFINVEEGETVTEKLVFTEEFVVKNPECAEIKELVDESKKFIEEGEFNSARSKLDEAINACKNAISQKSVFSKERVIFKFQDKIFLYLFILTISAILLGVAYYTYQRIMFRRALAEVEGRSNL